ncbi:MAG: hypothetical protein II200_07055 [Bacteroidaceae bacterium]|nr:hypothetical protein [Bacteroidaceae bacterium]
MSRLVLPSILQSETLENGFFVQNAASADAKIQGENMKFFYLDSRVDFRVKTSPFQWLVFPSFLALVSSGECTSIFAAISWIFLVS